MSSPDKESQRSSPVPKEYQEGDAGDGTKKEQQYLEGWRLAVCFLSVCLCLFLVSLDTTITTTIVSTVGNKFHAFEKVGWLASGFFLSCSVLIQPYGKISIVIGRKYCMVIAVVIFEVGSLLCALSNSMNMLIGGRVLAGVGAAGIQSMTYVIASEVLPIHKRPIGMAALSVVFGLSSVLGPVMGGTFTSRVSWRWAFYINLPFGGLALSLFILTFNPPPPQGRLKEKLKDYDYLGTFLMTSGLVVFMLAITFGGTTYRWGSAPVILCFILGILTLVSFCIWNFKFSKSPLIPYDIISIPEMIACFATASGVYSFFLTCFVYLPVYFQVVKGSDALASGLHFFPIIIALVLTSVLTGIFIQKTRYIKPAAVLGSVLGPIAVGILCLLDVNSSQASQIGLLVLTGVSTGLNLQSTIIGAQITAPPSPGSIIITLSLLSTIRIMFASIMIDLADAVYSSSIDNIYLKSLENESNQAIVSELSSFTAKHLISDNSFIKSLTPEAKLFVRKVVVKAIRNVFYMGVGLSGISVVGSVFMTNKRMPLKSENRPDEISTTKESETKVDLSFSQNKNE